MKKAVLIVLLALVIAGCVQQSPQPSVQQSPEPVIDSTSVKSESQAKQDVAMKSDDLVPFEAYLDTLLNQGHGVGHDVYDPVLERLSVLDEKGVTGEAMERIRDKVERLRPAAGGSPPPNPISATDPIKRGLLSPRGCNGTGSFKFGASPLAVEDILRISPMGGLSSVHITPTDHQYLHTVGSDGRSEDTVNIDRFKVYAPADGYIVEIGQGKDYRVIIEHSCTFYTIFIHVDKLSQKVMDEAGFKEGEVGKQAWPRIQVKQGEAFGSIGVGKLDFSVMDENITLKGFVRPETYEGEVWKIHTVDTFDYYEELLRSQLIAKNMRKAEPIGGKIDFDAEGKLVGSWFKEGTNGYRSDESEDYWKTHLSIVYDSIDPAQVRVSIGEFAGRAEQFGVKGNSPDPANIDGLVKYELMPFEYYVSSTGEEWDPRAFSDDVKARNIDEVRGVAIFQVMPENKLKAEFFPGKKAAEVAGFTASAMFYER